MSSEIEMLKTNEFLRRRKLRILQVREQSKEIAKKIRQRAELEKLRHIVELDAKKENEYLERQEKIVDELEKQYRSGVKNIGASHKSACDINEQETTKERIDLSKQRGKTAAAHLRHKRQKELDQKKKQLDRKLQAREVANELSREKGTTVAKKIKSDQIENGVTENIIPDKDADKNVNLEKRDQCVNVDIEEKLPQIDMATQWESNLLPTEWEPNILLPSDDNVDIPNNIPESSREMKSPKKMNLFAVSDEMPSSLRGNVISAPADKSIFKPSNVIAEYLRNRGMHLRENIVPKKTSNDDLQKIKKTIIHTRPVRNEARGSDLDKVSRETPSTTSLQKKGSVTMYNHSTRAERNVSMTHADTVVVRDLEGDEDAYSQALKETSVCSNVNDSHQKRLDGIRHKVATTKQKVEKEYQDTIAFLNSLPSNAKDRPIRKAYMPEYRQQQLKEKQQLKMQQEYRKIEREHRKQCLKSSHLNKHANVKCSKLPVNIESDDETPEGLKNIKQSNPHYNWIPVPESDQNLTVHKIPNTKQTHSVKFDDDDDDNNSYHEYRSRHKHTPPTKEKSNSGNKRKIVESVVINKIKNDTSSENSSLTQTSLNENGEDESNNIREAGCATSDNDRVIIYKILETASKPSERIKIKGLSKNVVTSLTSIDKEIRKNLEVQESVRKKSQSVREQPLRHSFEELTEGVYKTVKEKEDNISSLYYSDNEGNIRSNNKGHAACQCGHSIQPIKTSADRDKGVAELKINGDTHRSQDNTVKCSSCGVSTHKPELPESGAVGQTDSASTFKTATTDKGVLGQNHSDYVKLMEAADKEGKFYIGTTGFLKDDAYEVIIQLRKKDTKVEDKTLETKKSDKELITEPIVEAQKDTVQNVQEEIKEIKTNDVVQSTEVASSVEIEHDKYQYKEVQTSIVIDAIKTSTSRPGTSTYTQTSFSDTPVQRPTYFHMSSSTSTTYMSPPERIVPNFLKNDIQIQVVKNIEQDLIDNVKHSHTKTKTCKHKNRHNHKKQHIKKKSRKCKNSDESRTPNSSLNEIVFKKNVKSNKSLSTDPAFKIPIKFNKTSHMKRNKSGLHPVIKCYVHKVLKLNRENIKAVEIATQYCSSVSTPSSSIINTSSNVVKKEPEVTPTISLEQIKKMLDKHNDNTCKPLNTDSISQEHHYSRIEAATKSSKSETKINKHSKAKKRPVIKIDTAPISIKQGSQKNSKEDICKAMQTDYNSTGSISDLISDDTDFHQQNIEDSQQLKYVEKADKSTGNTSTASLDKNKNNTEKQTTCDLDKKSHNGAKTDFKLKLKAKTKTKSESNKTAEVTNTTLEQIKRILENQSKLSQTSSVSTQINNGLNGDVNTTQLEQDKIQNMQKMAELTEKCTKRLSDLAKILEEVRKSKSSAYSQLSSTVSPEFDKNYTTDESPRYSDDFEDVKAQEDIKTNLESNSPIPKSLDDTNDSKFNLTENNNFVPILQDIPRPEIVKPLTIFNEPEFSLPSQVKTRCKPPPVLTRANLKCGQEDIMPHELSTVPEVDSPMSQKFNKNQSGIDKVDNSDLIVNESNGISYQELNITNKNTNLDQPQTNISAQKRLFSNIENTDNVKLQMLDMSKFNELMLKPFVTIEEYAKQCNIGTLDEGSNLEDIPKDYILNDEISSMHSDGSLPDVVSELIKRNIMSEPFKFGSISNGTSTTISSGSSASMLALSKKRKHQINHTLLNQDRRPSDTSDSLSISSNPDLEKAFKNLGLGWASSTLKKTKERLALSSSTSTSTSSTSQKQPKKYEQDIPLLIKDSLSRDFSSIHLTHQKKGKTNKSKNTEQSSRSMTVKEFLTKELANKITFTNNSDANETEQHFTSLYSTKLPPECNVTDDPSENRSQDQPGSRQRTSTPVQLFKSLNYQTNSSSNNDSTGLFSNVDELSSVKVTSSSVKNSNTDKDDLSVPNYSLKLKKDKNKSDD